MVNTKGKGKTPINWGTSSNPSKRPRGEGASRSSKGNAPRQPSSNFTPYPFGKMVNLQNEKTWKLYRDFRKYEVIPPLILDIKDMENEVFMSELEYLLEKSELSWMIRADPGSYMEVMSEFLSSLEVTYKDGKPKKGWRSFKEALYWDFMLGGKNFRLTKEKFKEIMLLEKYDEEVPNINFKEVDEYWASIVHPAFNGKFSEESKTTTMIEEVVNKAIHRWVAANLFPRMDGGRYVNKTDLCVMHLIFGRSLWMFLTSFHALSWTTEEKGISLEE